VLFLQPRLARLLSWQKQATNQQNSARLLDIANCMMWKRNAPVTCHDCHMQAYMLVSGRALVPQQLAAVHCRAGSTQTATHTSTTPRNTQADPTVEQPQHTGLCPSEEEDRSPSMHCAGVILYWASADEPQCSPTAGSSSCYAPAQQHAIPSSATTATDVKHSIVLSTVHGHSDGISTRLCKLPSHHTALRRSNSLSFLHLSTACNPSHPAPPPPWKYKHQHSNAAASAH
jgi:hypothetical protein